MPDILIRVDMPRNCFECPLFSNCDACEGHECGCGLLGNIGYEEDISEDRRRDDCPLVELPEHGDLIDRDALISEAKDPKYLWMYDLTDVPEFLGYVPVIVPAERREG